MAAREDLPVEEFAASLLSEALIRVEQDRAKVIEGIRRGREDSAAGRVIPLEEWMAKMPEPFWIYLLW